MNRKHNPTTANEIQSLFANPEVALIAGLSVVVGSALLVLLLMTINTVGSLIQVATTGSM